MKSIQPSNFVREFKVSDLDRVRDLHQRFYDGEFEFPDIERAIAAFVVDDGQVRAFGMVRPIAESIMLLDKEQPIRKKIETLRSVVNECIFRTARSKYDQGHVFIQDQIFKDLLVKHFGLRPCKGEALVLDV